jgi:hypothetical protein
VSKLADKRCSSSGLGGVLSLRDNMASRASVYETGAAGGAARRRLPPLRFIMSTAPPPLEATSLPRRARSVTRET